MAQDGSKGGNEMPLEQQLISKGTLAMVNVGDDGEIAGQFDGHQKQGVRRVGSLTPNRWTRKRRPFFDRNTGAMRQDCRN